MRILPVQLPHRLHEAQSQPDQFFSVCLPQEDNPSPFSSVIWKTIQSGRSRYQLKTFKAAGNTFYISPALKELSCRGSANSETVCFKLHRFAGNVDLAECGCTVKMKNNQGTADIAIPDVSVEEQELRILWTLSSRAASAAGPLLVQLQFEKPCDDSSKTVNWQSNIMEFEIPESLDAAEAVIDQDPTVFSQWEKKVDALCADAAASAATAQQKVDAFSGYTREEMNNNFAEALTGEASGKQILLDDLQPGADLLSLQISGETIQAGTGDPSPDNPRPLKGVTAFTMTDDGAQPQVIALPQVLYGLTTGAADSFNLVNGQGVRKIGKVVLNGTENWARDTIDSSASRWKLLVPDAMHGQSSTGQILCSHYPAGMGTTWSKTLSITLSVIDEGAFYLFDTAHQTASLVDWKSWLAAQYAAGTPVTVLYELDAPVPCSGQASHLRPSSLESILSADAGTITVRYCRNSNAVLKKIQARIGVL